MTEASQHVFLQRILFMFDINKSKAGRCQSLKVPLATWNLEADLCAFMRYIMEQMRTHRTSDNNLVFPAEVMKTVMQSFIEGTFGMILGTKGNQQRSTYVGLMTLSIMIPWNPIG